MALFYVVPEGYTGSVPTGYTQLEVNDPLLGNDSFEVNSGDTYMISSALSGTIDITPSSSSYDQSVGTEFIIEGGNSSSTTLDFDTAAFRPDIVANITVPSGADASLVDVDAEDTDGMTLTVGDNAQLGDVWGGTGSTDNDVITTGTGSTIGNIDTNDGDNSVTIGGTAGTIQTEDGDDTITLLDGASSGAISSGDGDDVITLGAGATSGDIDASGGSDTINLGDGSTSGEITLSTGGATGDTVTGGNDVTVNGSISQATSDSYSTLTFGDNAQINGDVDLAGGQDSLSVGSGSTITGFISMGSDISADDADTLSLGEGTTVDSYINTGRGDDSLTIGDNSMLNGGSNAINTYTGDDTITIGAGVVAGNTIFTGAGSDVVNINETANVTVDMGINIPNDDVLNVTYSDQATYDTATTNQGWTVTGDPLGNTNVDGSNEDFNYGNFRVSDADYVNGTQVCFARGTMIETARGPIAIEDLAVGDLVTTRDNGLQPIRWINSNTLSGADLNAAPNLRPIRIKAGTLGKNTPEADLMVSPQHRVLVRSKIAQKMFGTPEVLVAAKQLCQIKGIDIADDVVETTYFHMLFDRHEIVVSNGAETESLFTGPEALKSIEPEAREEIFCIFPELNHANYQPEAVRQLATGRQGRQLAKRHAKNHKPLIEAAM